jgi:hypothetical protein
MIGFNHPLDLSYDKREQSRYQDLDIEQILFYKNNQWYGYASDSAINDNLENTDAQGLLPSHDMYDSNLMASTISTSTTSLAENQGFWLYLKQSKKVYFKRNSGGGNKKYKLTAKHGWRFFAFETELQADKVFNNDHVKVFMFDNVEKIWKQYSHKDNIYEIDTIPKNQAFWVNSNYPDDIDLLFPDEQAPSLVYSYPRNNSTTSLNYRGSVSVYYTFEDNYRVASIEVYDKEGNRVNAWLSRPTYKQGRIRFYIRPQKEGWYHYRLVARDYKGNTTEKQVKFYIDTKKPTTVATHQGGKLMKPITVDLISSEGSTIYYTTETGYDPKYAWWKRSRGKSPIKNIVIDKTTNLQFYAVDNAGNAEATQSIIYRFEDPVDHNIILERTTGTYSKRVLLWPSCWCFYTTKIVPYNEVTWERIPERNHYKVYRVDNLVDFDIMMENRKLKLTPPKQYLVTKRYGPDYRDEDIEEGRTYYYFITSVDNRGIESISSEPIKIEYPVDTEVINSENAIKNAKNYLKETQQTDGLWSSDKRLTLLNTTEALNALNITSEKKSIPIQKALMQLKTLYANNIDHLARKVYTLGQYNVKSIDETERLNNSSSEDGWGFAPNVNVAALETALAKRALEGSTTAQTITEYVQTLFELTFEENSENKLSNQNGHYGWSQNSEQDSIFVSSLFYHAFDAPLDQYEWIIDAQQSDGHFGNGILDTAAALLWLPSLEGINVNEAKQYLISQQNENGSWQDNVYLTALCLQALQRGE